MFKWSIKIASLKSISKFTDFPSPAHLVSSIPSFMFSIGFADSSAGEFKGVNAILFGIRMSPAGLPYTSNSEILFQSSFSFP